MTSELLRVVIFGIAIAALIAQFTYDLIQSREKKRDGDALRTTVDRLTTTVDRIENNVKQLVVEGKITKEEAQRVLNIKLGASMTFQENLKMEVTREPEVKKSQPD